MVDFEMDCSQSENGWFEVKAYLTNGGIGDIYIPIEKCFTDCKCLMDTAGWESDIIQSTCTGSAGGRAPYTSKNHLGRCGFVNVFDFGTASCQINPF